MHAKVNSTNQDSLGWENYTVLTLMYVSRKDTEVGNLFPLHTAFNFDEKRIIMQKPTSEYKKFKM